MTRAPNLRSLATPGSPARTLLRRGAARSTADTAGVESDPPSAEAVHGVHWPTEKPHGGHGYLLSQTRTPAPIRARFIQSPTAKGTWETGSKRGSKLGEQRPRRRSWSQRRQARALEAKPPGTRTLGEDRIPTGSPIVYHLDLALIGPRDPAIGSKGLRRGIKPTSHSQLAPPFSPPQCPAPGRLK
jgi:hypothetical protein